MNRQGLTATDAAQIEAVERDAARAAILACERDLGRTLTVCQIRDLLADRYDWPTEKRAEVAAWFWRGERRAQDALVADARARQWAERQAVEFAANNPEGGA